MSLENVRNKQKKTNAYPILTKSKSEPKHLKNPKAFHNALKMIN